MATSKADSTSSGQALANVHIVIAVSPTMHTMGQGANLQFTATVTGTPGAPYQSVNWQAVSWTADSVAGNSIVVEVRTGNTSTTDASWTAFRAVTSGQAIAATSQYAQYRVTLSTSVPNATPAVKEVVLTFLR